MQPPPMMVSGSSGNTPHMPPHTAELVDQGATPLQHRCTGCVLVHCAELSEVAARRTARRAKLDLKDGNMAMRSSYSVWVAAKSLGEQSTII